jgi:hypothetical protein
MGFVNGPTDFLMLFLFELAPVNIAKELIPAVVQFFPPAKAKKKFEATTLEISLQDDQGHALLIDGTIETPELMDVKQESPWAFGFMIESISMFIGRNVEVQRISLKGSLGGT